uniref:DBH-like monooxygenase protein 1 n=2 Tax=Hirondellea gigas TaxID=1518452 RepID=A0A2P2IGG7_9CRUS
MKHSFYIGFKPNIPDRTAAFVHHLVVYECRLEDSSNKLEKWLNHQGRQCFSPNMPTSWAACATPIVAWAVGSDGVFLPSHLATPVGEEHGGSTYFLFEVHYDNPNKLSAYMDGTKLLVYYTHTAREFNTGGIIIGSSVTPLQIIGPAIGTWQSTGVCDADCTKTDIPKEGITLVGGMLHTHLLGQAIKLQHIRDGKELPPILEDEHYDFNYQQERFMKQERLILPGDTMIVTCSYNTSHKVLPSFGGLRTTEEMCLAFMVYYPRAEIWACMSEPNFDGILESLGIEDYEKDSKNKTKGDKKGVNDVEVKEGEEIDEMQNLVDISMAKVFEKMTITKPFALKNMTLMRLLRERSLWRDEKVVSAMQEHMVRGKYRPLCLTNRDGKMHYAKLAEHEYPKYEPYVPPPTKCIKNVASAERPVNPKLQLKPKSEGD